MWIDPMVDHLEEAVVQASWPNKHGSMLCSHLITWKEPLKIHHRLSELFMSMTHFPFCPNEFHRNVGLFFKKRWVRWRNPMFFLICELQWRAQERRSTQIHYGQDTIQGRVCQDRYLFRIQYEKRLENNGRDKYMTWVACILRVFVRVYRKRTERPRSPDGMIEEWLRKQQQRLCHFL